MQVWAANMILNFSTSLGVNFPNPDGNFSTGVGGACPQGSYCPEGTSLPLSCPIGTYSDRWVNSNVRNIHIETFFFKFSLLNTISVVLVFIWQTPLAVVRVQRVTSVATQVSPIHLDCVRQDFTVLVETPKPRVEWQTSFYCIVSVHACGSVANCCNPSSAGWSQFDWFNVIRQHHNLTVY